MLKFIQMIDLRKDRLPAQVEALHETVNYAVELLVELVDPLDKQVDKGAEWLAHQQKVDVERLVGLRGDISVALGALKYPAPVAQIKCRFKLGDTVRLKSGGPCMTVTGLPGDGDRAQVKCTWFAVEQHISMFMPEKVDEERLRNEEFTPEALELCKPLAYKRGKV